MTFGAVAPHTIYEPRFIPGTQIQLDDYDVTHPLSSYDDTGYEGAISAMGADIYGSALAGRLGELRYETIGTTPNRVFVLQWSNVSVFGDGGYYQAFQIRLHETSNAVELAYGPSTTGHTNTVQVGLRGYDPSDFAARTGPSWPASVAATANTQAMPLRPGVVPPGGLSYTFTPPAPLPCPLPFSLIATNRTGTTATLTWRTLGSSPGPYQVVYGVAGFNPATATPVTATGPGLPITGLLPYTDYDFYVTQACGGAAGSSPQSIKGTFKTTLLNDDPVGALDLPVGATCQPVGSTTAGATKTTPATAPGYVAAFCGSTVPYGARQDVWYKFTTAATGPASTAVVLNATGTSAYQVLVLSSANGAAGPFTVVFCAETTTYLQPFGPVTVALLQPSTTYYVAVLTDTNTSTSGPITVCALAPPSCSDPTNLASSIANSTSTTARLTFTPGSGATSYTVRYTPVGGGTTTTVSPAPTASPIVLTGLAPATNYTVTVQATCGATGAVGTALPVAVGTIPANSTAALAQGLPIGATCQPVNGSNLNGLSVPTGQLPNPLGCGLDPQYTDNAWYRFTTAATGPASTAVRITVTGIAAGQVRVLAGSSAAGPFTQVACAGTSNTTAAPQLDLSFLTPNTTYYVLVGNYGGTPYTSGPFTICVSEPPACGNPTSLSVFNVTATSASLAFVAGTPAAGAYTVGVLSQGSSAAPVTFPYTGTGGQIPVTGLLPGTYYTLTLTANCTGSQSQPQSVTFRTAGLPANDLCAQAQALPCNQLLNGFTVGATADAEAGTLCTGAVAGTPGVWYRYVGTGADVTFSTCGSPSVGQPGNFDHRLHVFRGACGALTCLGGNDRDVACPATGGARGGASYTVATTAGTVYYVLISGVSGATGEFVLQAICQPAGTCPPPTNVRLVPSTNGSLSAVAFTPAPGATYTVVSYVLATGTGFTYGGNYLASPVDLSSAVPGQTYVLLVSSNCGNGSRSVAVAVPFSTGLASRTAALAAELGLYPNPARQQATLTRPVALRAQAATATLYNVLGQAVRTVAMPAGPADTVLNLQGLPTGAYLLRLHTGEITLSKRLSIE